MLPLGVVLPALNEAEALNELISRIKRFTTNIIIVNDGSTDHTPKIARQSHVYLLSNRYTRGKGISLRKGLRLSLKFFAGRVQYVATLDADGQHAPEDLPRMYKMALKTQADLMVGNRVILSANGNPMPNQRYIINHLTSKFIRKIFKIKIHDTQCGFRLYNFDVLKKLLSGLTASQFDIETEILLEAWSLGLKIKECPIQLIYPSNSVYKSHVSKIDVVRWMKLVFFRILKSSNLFIKE